MALSKVKGAVLDLTDFIGPITPMVDNAQDIGSTSNQIRNIFVKGTVDGRDVAADGTKLDSVTVVGLEINVKGFGATGDGVTDDSIAVLAAVADALATSRFLHWPAGNYLVPSSIPNFNDVTHKGEGTIKRAANTWTIENLKGNINFMFVDSTGLDTNDGLAAVDPLLTLQAAINAVEKHHGDDGSRWEIVMAAGTYTEGGNTGASSIGGKVIEVRGPAVANSAGNSIVSALTAPSAAFTLTEVVTGGMSGATGTVTEEIIVAGSLPIMEIAITSGTFTVGELITGAMSGSTANLRKINIKPSAIVDGTSATNVAGITISDSTKFTVKDIQFQNFSLAGVRMQFCFAIIENVHVRDSLEGYNAVNKVSYSVEGGLVHSCDKAVKELFSVVRNFLTVTTIADGFEARNCIHGLFAKEHCTGHLDWSTFEDNTFGIMLNRSSTANASDCVVKRNDRGIVLNTASFLVPNRIDFGDSALDPNTITNWLFSDAGGFTQESTGEDNVVLPVKDMTEKQLKGSTAVVTHTGDTVETTLVTLGKYVKGSLRTEGEYIRIDVQGQMSGGNGTGSLRIELGGSNMIFATIPAGTYSWRGSFKIAAIDDNNQSCSWDVAFPVTPFGDFGRVNRTLNFNLTSTRDIEVKVLLANAADVVTITDAASYAIGMGAA